MGPPGSTRWGIPGPGGEPGPHVIPGRGGAENWRGGPEGGNLAKRKGLEGRKCPGGKEGGVAPVENMFFERRARPNQTGVGGKRAATNRGGKAPGESGDS